MLVHAVALGRRPVHRHPLGRGVAGAGGAAPPLAEPRHRRRRAASSRRRAAKPASPPRAGGRRARAPRRRSGVGSKPPTASSASLRISAVAAAGLRLAHGGVPFAVDQPVPDAWPRDAARAAGRRPRRRPDGRRGRRAPSGSSPRRISQSPSMNWTKRGMPPARSRSSPALRARAAVKGSETSSSTTSAPAARAAATLPSVEPGIDVDHPVRRPGPARRGSARAARPRCGRWRPRRSPPAPLTSGTDSRGRAPGGRGRGARAPRGPRRTRPRSPRAASPAAPGGRSSAAPRGCGCAGLRHQRPAQSRGRPGCRREGRASGSLRDRSAETFCAPRSSCQKSGRPRKAPIRSSSPCPSALSCSSEVRNTLSAPKRSM